MTKTCVTCGEEKELSDFGITTAKNTGKKYHISKCKACDSKRRVEAQRTVKGYWQRVYLRHKVTKEQWLSIWHRQGQNCEICKTTDPGNTKGWQLDHDHKTGKIRGILCWGCNNVLGSADDEISTLQFALSYLEQQ